MFKIAVCDDEAAERRRTVSLIQGYLNERPQFEADVSLFEGGQALLAAVEETGGFDLYLLDIIMPEENGIEVGKAIRQMDWEGAILYLTVSPDYAVDSYLTQAFFYLLKPVERDRLFEVLDRAVAEFRKRKGETAIVNSSSGLRSIPMDKILYAERVDRFMRYHLTDKETVDSCTLRGSFHEAAAPLLADKRFVLCGASSVLNLSHVKSVERGTVILDSGGRATVARSAFGELKRAWMNYWLESKTT